MSPTKKNRVKNESKDGVEYFSAEATTNAAG
jgi:hypothetical protein